MNPDQDLKGIVLPQTCLFLWRWIVRESACLLGSIATQSQITSEPTLITVSSIKYQQTHQPSFSLTLFSEGYTFVSSSKWTHGFVSQSKQAFQTFFLMTGRKNKNTIHTQYTPRVFYFLNSQMRRASSKL